MQNARMGGFLLVGDLFGLEPLRAWLEQRRPVYRAPLPPGPLAHRAIGLVLAAEARRVGEVLPLVGAPPLADVPLLVVTDEPVERGVQLDVAMRRGLLLARRDWIELPDAARSTVGIFAAGALARECRIFGVSPILLDVSEHELTPRQLEIAARAVDGLSVKEIAAELGLATSTVHNQMSKILGKCGLPGGGVAQLRRLVEGLADAQREESAHQVATCQRLRDSGGDRCRGRLSGGGGERVVVCVGSRWRASSYPVGGDGDVQDE